MSDTSSGRFKGANVLVVEDEAIVSFLIEDILLGFGCNAVWHAANVDGAHAILDKRIPDIAVLDVNLSGEDVYPIAARLRQLEVPFLFATGYGLKGVAPEWQAQPIIQKPFDDRTLRLSLQSILDARA